MRAEAHETRAVDDVSLAVEDRLQKNVVFARVIFQISILDDNYVALGIIESRLYGSAFSVISPV